MSPSDIAKANTFRYPKTNITKKYQVILRINLQGQ